MTKNEKAYAEALIHITCVCEDCDATRFRTRAEHKAGEVTCECGGDMVPQYPLCDDRAAERSQMFGGTY